jgi:hypothetical protein
MNWQDSTNGLKPTSKSVLGRRLAANPTLTESPDTDQLAELNEGDDGVEALIIRMDRTTAEHLFLRAQRRC